MSNKAFRLGLSAVCVCEIGLNNITLLLSKSLNKLILLGTKSILKGSAVKLCLP